MNPRQTTRTVQSVWPLSGRYGRLYRWLAKVGVIIIFAVRACPFPAPVHCTSASIRRNITRQLAWAVGGAAVSASALSDIIARGRLTFIHPEKAVPFETTYSYPLKKALVTGLRLPGLLCCLPA
ncbi:unnamed protein product [Protopolystoma xenopodis]|uniref:Uncharacterized protein n=1 Tax=Protopolystoma xenopodis TaxID=117903 RepID=A0A448WQT1_9PLAT|nr:unnamed protein product [Protopolystoma xenopodis]